MGLKKYSFIFLAIVLFACDSNRVYESNATITKQGWNYVNKQKFYFQISDTVSAHNLYINLRQNDNYAFLNIYLFVSITSPKGVKITDTVNCILQNSKGRWLGKKYDGIYSNKFLYKKNIRFATPGNYKIELEQAMRNKILKDVEDIGIRLEKAN